MINNDGDLDLYIGVSQIQDGDLSKDKNPVSVDKLYENIWDDSLNHPKIILESIFKGKPIV